MVLTARRLYERGVEHGNAGRNAAARRALHAAQTRTEDPDLRARIAGTLAYVASRTGEPELAEQLCREGLADPRVGEKTRAILYGQLGVLALMRGEAVVARDLLGRAIETADDDGADAGRMRLNRSVAAMQLGDLEAARADLSAAADIFERAEERVERAKALHNLGYAELLAGDLVKALGDMARARPALEQESAAAAAQCDLDRAEVLRDAGLTTEAERILERVARVFGAHGMRQARAEAELGLARSLLTHDPARAAALARVAARGFRRLGSRTWEARAQGVEVRARLSIDRYGGRGAPIKTPGRVPGADEVEFVAGTLDGHGMHHEAVAVRRAHELRARAGDPRRRIVLSRTEPMATQLLAHQVRAHRAELDGDGAAVRRHCARGLEDLMQRHRSFGSLDLQTSAAMHAGPLMMTALPAAVATRRAGVVFDWSERARHLSQSVTPLRPPPDRALAADLAALRRLKADDPEGDWLADPEAVMLRNRVRDRQWGGTGVAGIEDRASLEEVQAALDRDTALIAYVWSGDRVAGVVVTRDDARFVDVAAWQEVRRLIAGLRAELDVAAAVRAGPMADRVRGSLFERLTALSQVLLDAPLTVAGERRLVITVPGVLNGIPWAMLPGTTGRAFTLAPSATRWVHARGGHRAVRPRVAFVSGPRVARGDEEVGVGAAKWAGATIVREAEASVHGVTSLASATDVLHIAAHGRHAVDNPMFSGLELADGTLFGYDIDLIERLPETVVLSACEVGRSSVRWGEEAVGMTRIWLHAGTRSVVAAPVVVADDDACELLAAMHQGLAAGLPPSEALAAASDRTGIVAPFQVHGAGF